MSQRHGKMEIFGIGTDIIECPRIGKMIEHHGELFLRRVYTEREIRYCQARKHAIEHFAGRWAAKEAILKAMGTGRSHGISWTNVEVRNGQDGRPQVLVCGAARETAVERGIGNILVSISHCRTYATAYALALGRPAAAPNPRVRHCRRPRELPRRQRRESANQVLMSSLIFASVASPGWRVPLHWGYWAHPRKKPRRLRRTSMGPPQSSQVSSTGTAFKSSACEDLAGLGCAAI